MTIAITADEKLALVSVPNRVDPNDKTKLVNDNFMQVVDLEANPPKIIAKVDLGNHPLGVSVNKAGTLALAAHQDGNVSVMSIKGKDVKRVGTVKIGDPITSVRMVAITPDGKWALVGKRGTDTIAVLSIDGEKVTLTKVEITVGSNPYGIDISNDGRWAVVGNAGRGEGSNDTVSIIDLTREPFRNVQTLTVGPGVESVAISPNSRYIAVNNQNMTNVPKANPLRTENGRVMLFELREGAWVKRDELPIGHNPQGLVFTPDGRYLVVQNYGEKELAYFSVTGGELKDTGQRFPVPGYPSGIRTAPQ
jgi:DNA-binding beta-propeller fold protein YncE